MSESLAGVERHSFIPRPEQVDAGWISSMLAQRGIEADLVGVSAQPIGTGQLGETVRFTLRYKGERKTGPATLVGKFAANDPTSRHIADAWSLYEREVRFYGQLAGSALIAVPACYGAALADDGTFALLLEDLAPARTGDQIEGMTLAEAAAAVRESAKLHASFWAKGEEPELAWLETGPLAQPFYSADVFCPAWSAFQERYADLLTDTQRGTCELLAEHYESYRLPLNRPRCITHNDYRPDNMLFGANGLIRIVDWQSVALGYNAVDVAYLIGGAFSPENRRMVETELIDTYHEELVRQGVRDYPRNALDDDYRHFSFAGINVAVAAAMLVKRTERGDRMFLTMLERHVAHVADWDALSILSRQR